LKGENINLKLIFIQHLLPITNIFDKAAHTSTSNKEGDSCKKKLSFAQLTIENRHTPSGLPFCVFRDGSVNYFGNFFLFNL